MDPVTNLLPFVSAGPMAVPPSVDGAFGAALGQLAPTDAVALAPAPVVALSASPAAGLLAMIEVPAVAQPVPPSLAVSLPHAAALSVAAPAVGAPVDAMPATRVTPGAVEEPAPAVNARTADMAIAAQDVPIEAIAADRAELPADTPPASRDETSEPVAMAKAEVGKGIVAAAPEPSTRGAPRKAAVQAMPHPSAPVRDEPAARTAVAESAPAEPTEGAGTDADTAPDVPTGSPTPAAPNVPAVTVLVPIAAAPLPVVAEPMIAAREDDGKSEASEPAVAAGEIVPSTPRKRRSDPVAVDAQVMPIVAAPMTQTRDAGGEPATEKGPRTVTGRPVAGAAPRSVRAEQVDAPAQGPAAPTPMPREQPAMPAAGSAPAPGDVVQSAAAAPAQPVMDSAAVAARPGRMGEEMGVAIARHVTGSAGTGSGETIAIRLDPAEMGRIEVKLSFDDSGTLRAVVAADQPASLDLLRREGADLVRALSDAGVAADSRTLSFDSRGSSGSGGGSAWQREQQARRSGEEAGTQAGEVKAAYQPIRARGRVDVMA